MKLNLYINDQYYKTITVELGPRGGYDSIKIINGLHDDLAKGLLGVFEPIGKMAIRIEPAI